MEGILAALIGFVGIALGMLIMIRSDIKWIIARLGEHGERLARIESGVEQRAS